MSWKFLLQESFHILLKREAIIKSGRSSGKLSLKDSLKPTKKVGRTNKVGFVLNVLRYYA